MKLKTATLIVIIALIVLLVLNLFNWCSNIFLMRKYSNSSDIGQWVRHIIWLVQILLQTIPMIIFFGVLNSKQKGQDNE